MTSIESNIIAVTILEIFHVEIPNAHLSYYDEIFPARNSPLGGESRPPCNTMFLGPTQVCAKQHPDRFSRFAMTYDRHRQTQRPTDLR